VSRHRTVVATLLLSTVLAQGCVVSPDGPATSASGERDGLTLSVDLHPTSDSLVVETTVRNGRTGDVHLDADQCGRITELVLARTVFEPEGKTYDGSLAAVKEIVLARQRSSQDPDRFQPRKVSGGTDVPDCVRPTRPVTVTAGGTVQERWELPFDFAYGLQAVGAANTVVRAELVESEAPDSLRFLDILPTGEADDVRKDRNVRVEIETSKVLQLDPKAPLETLSIGQRFDRMVDDDVLREFLLAQPAESWRHADLMQTRFKAVTTTYERAVAATVSSDGSRVSDLQLPGPADLTRVFERRPATLPPGIARIPERDDLILSDDLIPDPLVLPSGAVVADGALAGEVAPLPFRAEPGSYPVHVTLALQPGSAFDNVVLASLVLSDAPTVTWREVSVVGVDGGTAGFTSVEGSKALGASIDTDPVAWSAVNSAAFDSLTAHDSLASEYPIDEATNLVLFSTGYGDGGYPVFVGLDAAGRPTRYVIDFQLIHLAWPGG
jgi:hypothetical protein